MSDTMIADQQKRADRMPAPTSHHTVPGLQRARVRAYLTQRQLAQKAGVATSTVARAEQGYPMSVLVTQRIADALGVSLRELREAPPEE
jgi:transcriptional regulator with XRE-family HTH domain